MDVIHLGFYAADHIADLFWEFELFLLYDLFVFDNVNRDVVIDESEDIEIHEVDRAFDLDDIFFAHFIALRIFDDCGRSSPVHRGEGTV